MKIYYWLGEVKISSTLIQFSYNLYHSSSYFTFTSIADFEDKSWEEEYRFFCGSWFQTCRLWSSPEDRNENGGLDISYRFSLKKHREKYLLQAMLAPSFWGKYMIPLIYFLPHIWFTYQHGDYIACFKWSLSIFALMVHLPNLWHVATKLLWGFFHHLIGPYCGLL